jgi:hypothetical protein
MKKILIFICLIGCVKLSTAFSNHQKINNKEYFQFKNIEELFKTFDGKAYKKFIEDKSELEITLMNKELASKISKYLESSYGKNIEEYSKSDPEAVILLGLFYNLKEKGVEGIDENGQALYGGTPTSVSDGDALGCLLAGVGALIGLADIRNLYNAFVAGAAEATIIGSVKIIFKRIGIIFGVISAIYSIGHCFGWW